MADRVVERDAGQVAGAADAVGKGLVGIAALAVELTGGGCTLDKIYKAAVGVAADAQRSVGAGDQKRPREAAGDDRRPGAGAGRLLAKPRHILSGRRRARRRRLRELVDPLLEELLVGPQIGELIRLG